MPKKILDYVLIFLTTSSAFFSWYFVDRAILGKDSSDFWVPLSAFSFFVVSLGLLMVLVREKAAAWLTFFLALSLSFVFVHSLLHLAIIVLAWLFIFAAQKSIREDIATSMKINLAKSLHRGSFLIVIALALMISSQYYFSVRTLDNASIAPEISEGGMTSWIISRVLPWISPEFQQVKSDKITTDEFLGEMYEKIIKKEREKEEIKNKAELENEAIQSEQAEKIIENELGRKLTVEERNQLEGFKNGDASGIPSISLQVKQEVLREWKKELSKAAGSEVLGDEKVADIFVAIVNFKIDELAEPREGMERSRILPLILTMVLFLTLIPLGSFFSHLWIMVTAVTFWIMRKTGLVKIETESRKAEVIR